MWCTLSAIAISALSPMRDACAGMTLCPPCPIGFPLDERAIEVHQPRPVEPPDPRGDLAQARPVVAHQQHRLLVLVQRILEHFDVLDVDGPAGQRRIRA